MQFTAVCGGKPGRLNRDHFCYLPVPCYAIILRQHARPAWRNAAEVRARWLLGDLSSLPVGRRTRPTTAWSGHARGRVFGLSWAAMLLLLPRPFSPSGSGGNYGGDCSPSGPPVPADPSNPTAAEIVARMAEPEN